MVKPFVILLAVFLCLPLATASWAADARQDFLQLIQRPLVPLASAVEQRPATKGFIQEPFSDDDVEAPQFADVFIAGKDPFPSIRIPSVVVTKSGLVLAFAEGRAAAADQAKN